MAIGRLTKGAVDAAKPRRADYIIWDQELKGFGLKVCKGGRKVYICQYRTVGGRRGTTRRVTIGAHGAPWTVQMARAEARRFLGRAASGEDPAGERRIIRAELTVAQLCDLYIADGCATKKASTLVSDRGRIVRHIKPLLGKKRLSEVTRADIQRFLQDVAQGKTATDVKTGKRGRAIVKGGRGTATRTVGLLGGIFAFAVDAGLIRENPVAGVKRFPDRKGERYLNVTELEALGRALHRARENGENPMAIDIILLLIFTGARKGEIESLKWADVALEAGYLRFSDTKTGPRVIPLNSGAMEILGLQLSVDQGGFVFPASTANGYYVGTPKVWRRVRDTAGLHDVRLHDLRHSFASIAVSGGSSLPIIGGLLGHRSASTTHRYAHLMDDPLRKTSEAVAGQIAEAMHRLDKAQISPAS